MSKKRIFSFLFYCITITKLLAQTAQDSIIHREDSLSRIKLSFDIRDMYTNHISQQVDTGYLLHDEPGIQDISLPNYQSLYLNKNKIIKDITDFQNGLIAHEKYFFNLKDLVFLKPNKPYTEVEIHEAKSYTNSRANLQDNLNAKVLFASVYRDNIIWNLQYHKTNQNGMYAYQRNRMHAFSTGLSIAPIKSKLSADLFLIYNYLLNQHNFGIIDSSNNILSRTLFRIRESIPVYSTTAKSGITHRDFGFKINYNPFNNTSSKHKIIFSNLSSVSGFKFNYTDVSPASAYSLYKHYLIDSSNINFGYDQNQWTNNLSMTASLDSNLELSIHNINQWTRYNYGVSAVDFWKSIIQTNAIYKINSAWKLYANYTQELSFDKQYHLSSKLVYQLSNNIKLAAKFFIQSTAPSLMDKLLISNNKLIHYNQFLNQKVTAASVHLVTSNAHLPSISYYNGLIKNFIYIDTDLKYKQTNQEITQQSISIDYSFEKKYFGTNHHFYYEDYKPDLANWNRISARHDVHVNTHLFKKSAQSTFGFTYDWIHIDHVYQFIPMINQFATSTESAPPLINSLNFYARFQISTLQLTIINDHIDSFFNKRQSIVKNYPVFGFYTGINIKWKFTY